MVSRHPTQHPGAIYFNRYITWTCKTTLPILLTRDNIELLHCINLLLRFKIACIERYRFKPHCQSNRPVDSCIDSIAHNIIFWSKNLSQPMVYSELFYLSLQTTHGFISVIFNNSFYRCDDSYNQIYHTRPIVSRGWGLSLWIAHGRFKFGNEYSWPIHALCDVTIRIQTAWRHNAVTIVTT